MKKITLLALLSLILAWALVDAAPKDSQELQRYNLVDGKYSDVLIGEVFSRGKVTVDTVYLMGGPDRPDGKFQDANGAPDEQGWIGVDLTAPTELYWHVDDYYCQNLDPENVPNHAWWCGKFWPDDCETDDFGGYGNSWWEQLDWTGTVDDPTLSTTVTVSAVLNYDVEPGYDFLYLQYENSLGMQNVLVYNGTLDSAVVNESFNLTPADYTGENSDEVHLRWYFDSDGGWSDEDCLWPTIGAAQIDLITITFNQGGGPVPQGSVEDCDDNPLQWYVTMPVSVGDFSKVWPFLNEIDPCRSNGTPCFAFIDDGVVVPGTGGYLCTTWCYGPGGYIVNPEGGLVGPDFRLENEIWSPVLTWPAGDYEGIAFEFDVYRHEPLSSVSPGIFYVWHVRSADTDLGEDILEAGWQDRNFVYYGGPDWIRVDRFSPLSSGGIVTDLLVPGRDEVQLALGVYELSWIWDFLTDGTPAPYFDNVAVLVYAFAGPAISTREIDIAQDNFPQIGNYDYDDPAANHIRFDMARNIALPAHLRNDPGDSIIVDVVPVRTGSVLNDLPKLYYKLFPNYVFDPVRTLPNEGWIYGDTTYASNGSIIEDRYNFDLPDTGFFFPGDVIHYYIEGQDNVGGDIGTTLLPADTAGFASPPGYPNYDSTFRVQGLPTFNTLTAGDHPQILFWNDFANRGGENEWYTAFHNNGYQHGVDYDVYYTNGPSSGVGNGLGGRATVDQLAGYRVILYTCGDLSYNTISNGDFQNDAGNDVGVLDEWFRQGGGSVVVRTMFLTGDNLAFDLTQNAGTATQQFVSDWIGVNYVDQDLRPLIDNQSAPLVQPLMGNSLNLLLNSWIAYGGCLGFNTFDAVTAAGTTERVAEFLDPSGAAGQYPYAAMTLHVESEFNARVVYLPYDLMFVYTDPDNPPPPQGYPMSARAVLLDDILLFFGYIGSAPTQVPDAGVFTVKNYPNPFNPATKIEFNMPRRGELTIKIYNVRGELVKTLIDEIREAGEGFVIWDGTDHNGHAVASGVYFYETQAFGEVTVNKVALIR